MLRHSFYLLLFLLSLFATAAVIRGLVPERLKIEWFESVQDHADVVFLGSSHVFRQFDPALFDEIRGTQGGDFRSYNLGTPGIEFAEEMYLLRRLLLENPPNLDWIVVEAQPFRTQFRNDNDFGFRRIGWHDSATTQMMVGAIWRSSMPVREKWDLVSRHVEHWWRRTINLARGTDVWNALGQDRMSLFPNLSALGPHEDGYFPLQMETANKQSRGMRKGFLRSPDELFQGRKALLKADNGGAPGEELLAIVREMEAMAAERDISIVWWLHPNLERFSGWRELLEQGDLHHLVAHDDPQNFPEFYQVAFRFDLFHLNQKGSEKLTRSFAQSFPPLRKGAKE